MATATAVISSRTDGIAAEGHLEEVFDTYNEDGTRLGRELRAVCHAKGIWHKAVYCFVFNSKGQLLIQKRAAAKKVGPGQWDLSVAEHLSPGESFAEGVLRGLQEELGIEGAGPLQGPLAPMHQRRLVLPEKGIYDYEFVESYRVDCFDGPISFNAGEVSEVRFVGLDQVRREMQDSPEHFTVWFREELAALDFFGG